MFDHIETYCMFIGQPRSGHSLVGALLDAHPDVLVSIELDALARIRDGVDRATLFGEIAGHARRFEAAGRMHMNYDYSIPGAWQGALRRLRVIGDKKGGRSSWWLHDEPELLDRLCATVEVPVRFIHVVRSVWDNIATISTRGMPLDDAIRWYFETCEAIEGIKARLPAGALHALRHEAMVTDPRRQLFALADFLDVERNAQWADACAAMINPTPSRTRHRVEWSAAQRETVRRGVERFAWLPAEDIDFDATPRLDREAA